MPEFLKVQQLVIQSTLKKIEITFVLMWDLCAPELAYVKQMQ